jgi:hypothetical protein
LPSLVADMLARDHAIEDFEAKYGRDNARALHGNPCPISEWGFDLGGPCFTTMPRETIAIDGLNIAIDCDHFEIVMGDVEKSNVRRFADGPTYHKLKFWHHATVLTVDQMEQLRNAMRSRLGHALKRSAEFYAKREAEREARKATP